MLDFLFSICLIVMDVKVLNLNNMYGQDKRFRAELQMKCDANKLKGVALCKTSVVSGDFAIRDVI